MNINATTNTPKILEFEAAPADNVLFCLVYLKFEKILEKHEKIVFNTNSPLVPEERKYPLNKNFGFQVKFTTNQAIIKKCEPLSNYAFSGYSRRWMDMVRHPRAARAQVVIE